MNERALAVTPALGAQAWRFTFAPAGTDETSQMVIREPRHAAVTAQALALDAMLAAALGDANDDEVKALVPPGDPAGDTTPANLAREDLAPGPDDALCVVWLPTGNAVPSKQEKRLAQWVEQGGDHVVRATIRTTRVVWTGQRALVYASPDEWPDTLDAVVRFTLLARDTVALEREMKSLWPALEKHAALTHAVNFRDGRLQARVNHMTEAVTRMRISYLQIESALEQTDPGLGSASKRLCAELVLQAGIYDRLEVMCDPIEFAVDHYELANTRLIDHKHASVEFFLTGLIVVALVVQTAVILVQELLK
jgi:hypothetical protein